MQPEALLALDPDAALAPGCSWPLGAHPDANGVNFALVAPRASQVWLCLFDASCTHETARLPMPGFTHGVWHGYLPDAIHGLIYGYRVAGPYAPAQGERFNSNKVLLDPYAREVVGQYQGQPEFFDYLPGDPAQPCPLDNAASAIKGRVIDPAYDWQDDQPPRIASSDMVLYECHVKGFTQCWPGMAPELQGSYAALGEPAVLDYLQALGITSLSLLPIHAHADEPRLLGLGLNNYWGYNTLAFFAAEARYVSRRPGANALNELRDAVRALHRRGIEVLLDVVYNHSAEGDEQGPSFSLRGIDNRLYYHFDADQSGQYRNWTGCGNSINLSEPRVLQLVLDSLRYWVEVCHVDGFRFDLAPMLGRDADGFSRQAVFFSAVLQDPVLNRVKLIAEPWDLGPQGYQLGQFPAGWLEWNDQYRDTMRGFWLQQQVTLGEFARRFAGSSDLFQQRQRQPSASVNFISAHDGFTLQDLVSYNHKHNQANGEHNRDGHDHNLSWNCGVDGATDAPDIRHLRGQLQRALLATLFFSQGTPMLLAGDEIGHSQCGNNNAYCQDNATTWLNRAHADHGLLVYVQRLLALRRRFPLLRHDQWFADGSGQNAPHDSHSRPDNRPGLIWRAPSGHVMTAQDWHNQPERAISILLQDQCAASGDMLLLINAQAQQQPFILPPGKWCVLLNSHTPEADQMIIEHEMRLQARSLWLAILVH